MRIVRAILITLSIVLVQQVMAQSITGYQPFGSFSNAGVETVNLGNLNAHWAIPVVSRSGKIPFSFAINYDSTVYTVVNNIYTLNFEPDNFGWQQPLNAVFGSVSFSDVPQSCIYNGTEYDWDDYTFTAYVDRTGTAHPVNFSISDVSYQQPPCNRSDSNGTSGSATSTDGAAYVVTASVNSSGRLSGSVTSPDGDVIVPPSFGAAKWTDRNGNQLSASVTTSGGHEIVTFTDTLGTVVLTDDDNLNAPQHTYSYTKPGGGTAYIVFNFTPMTVRTNFACQSIAVGDFGPWTENLVSSVQLPDGTSYAFTYEPTPGYPGDVTGRPASITLPSGGSVTYQYTGANNGASCNDATILGYNRSSQDGSISYSRSGNTTTVSDGHGKVAQYVFNSQYYELSRSYIDGGTTLETVNTNYNGAGLSHITKSTVLPNGLQNKTDSFYNNGLITEADDYDWGYNSPGSLIRKTLTSYASLGNGITDKPSQVTIQDAAGTVKAQTTYSYDQTSVTPSGATQLQPISGARGNATTISSWVQGASSVQRTITYWDTGLVKSATDFNGNSISYAYGSCNASFPTSVSMPLGLSQSMAWDCNGGVMTSQTDANNQQATFTFGDPNFWRVTQTTDPIGGQTTASYNTSSTPWSVLQTVKINSTQSATAKIVMDGLGRAQQTQLTSDPDGTVYADRTYDLDSNLRSVSNPYRSASDSTYGVTSFAYDAAGRTTQQTEPDGNVATISISSNCATSTDDAGKKREACVDGLGRTVTVYEPDGNNNLTIETDYQYDVLGNLTAVTQKGGSTDSTQWRTRSFSYDGLSRLTQATTPEAGTVRYSYISGSSLCSGDPSQPCSRTDARGIVTTYSYDALNRLTGKTYSDGTAAVAYYYDQSSYNGLAIANGKARRTGMSDGTGQTAWSYDGAGNVLTRLQTINGVSSSIGYTYNNDGSVATMTSPNGHVYSYGYNNAQQPVSLSDSASGITYVSGAHYAAPGGLTSARHGLNLAITETNSYNNRLQPTLLSASAAAQTVFSLSYNWNLPGNKNNGSVYQVANNRDGTRSVQYGYDQMNRLASAGTYNSATWGNSYAYDNWGNLLQKSVTQGTAENLQVTVDAGNHINTSGFQYDASGNLTWDGSNALKFDAENRVTPYTGYVYSYDGDDRRVEKNYQGSITYYWYDDNFNVISTSGAYTRDYVYFGGKRIAFLGIYSGNQHYLWGGIVGSDDVMSNSDGSNIEWEADYFPYGAERQVFTSQVDNFYLFGGYEFDYEMGYSYADYREQSPVLGRFFSPDPVSGDPGNPQSWNRYAYVLNNPANLTDPLGLWPGGGGGCGGDRGARCGSPALLGGCPAGGDAGGFTVPCAAANNNCIIDGGQAVPCDLAGGSDASYLAASSFGPCSQSRWDGNVYCGTGDNIVPYDPVFAGSLGNSGGGKALPYKATNNGTPQIPTKTQERLERLKNCALGYYGIDPLSVSGLTSNGAKWGLIAAGAGGIPKAIPEGLGLVRTIRPPGSSSFTSLFSIISATSGGGALRTVANFGSKWAGPIAIASAVIDATAIGICTAMD